MSEPLGAYTFLPWVREGLARAIDAADEDGASLSARVTLPVRLRVDGAGEVATTVRLHGPGDVTGLHPSAILATDPRPGTTSFEANYMPTAQLARADLPWLFTPASASAGGRLRPWLCLVVVRRRDGVRLDPNPAGPLPVLEIGGRARPAEELPDLAQSWAWAHAQIAGATTGHTPAELLRDAPQRATSRLVCPRALRPQAAYLGCLVPAFSAGVEAGLGLAVDEDRLEPAWRQDAAAVRLPVYHAWQFATGAAGGFETLAGRLRPRPPRPDAVAPPALDLSDAGGGLPALNPATPGAVVPLESVLRLPGPDAPPPWPEETRVPFERALERVLAEAPDDTVTAPIYGAAQAGADAVPPAGAEPAWLRELNLDPRMRVAAGAGARVVQERQEQFMAEAWAQAGAVREVNDTLRRSQMARELGGALMERHLAPLSPGAFLAVTQPAHARVSMADRTVEAELHASRTPATAVSGAMRRLASPQGPLARRAAPRTRRPLELLAALDRRAAAPPPAAPTGIVWLDLGGGADPAPADERPTLAPASIQARMLDRLRPATTVLTRVRARVHAPAATWTRPDALAPVALGPNFPRPMYEGLRDVAPDLLLPGLGHVEPDSVALLEPSPRVIEAYMVGLNHEMTRELLWREFPADLRATPFRRFWAAVGPAAGAEIPPIHEWADAPLGGHLGAGAAPLVLLVRGELLRRFPATTIYAAPATKDGGLDPTTRLFPRFRGAVAPDVTFIGLPLSEEAARGIDPAGPGWHVVFEEHPGEPRFGFDDEGPAVPSSPDELAWAHVPLTASGHADLSRPLTAGGEELQAAWRGDAGRLAALTLQKPFRVAIHASRLLGPPVAP